MENSCLNFGIYVPRDISGCVSVRDECSPQVTGEVTPIASVGQCAAVTDVQKLCSENPWFYLNRSKRAIEQAPETLLLIEQRRKTGSSND